MTADLLDLIAYDETPLAVVRDEWTVFTTALFLAQQPDGLIDQTILRNELRGAVGHKRIGAFTHRAIKECLIEYDHHERSTDTEGGNGGKWVPIYRRVAS